MSTGYDTDWPIGDVEVRAAGPYASGWKDGFTAGAVDALRQAARRLEPETWGTLIRLSDEYEQGGDDE